MKKFFKLIFGRLTLIALSIILQFALIVGLMTGAGERYYWFQLFNLILSVIVFLHLVKREMYPDAKLPWLAFILVVPLFGMVAYILFSYNPISRKQKRIYQNVYKYGEYFEFHVEKVNIPKPYLGQSEYIQRTAFLPPFDNTKARYLPQGEDFWEALKADLKTAEKFIFMEYFIIERGIMWNEILEILIEKVKQGVDVRVMYDDIGSISKVSAFYDRTLAKTGIKCVRFNPFRPIMTGIHNNRDHRKITVIDGKIGYVSGANLADEYINKVSPHGHWKDSAVRLHGEAVGSLTLMFLVSYCVQTGVSEDFQKFMNVECEQFTNCGFIQPFVDGPAPFSPEHVGENVYINIISQAQDYLYITTPYLIIDHELKSALRTAAMRGVDVRIITPHIPDKKIVFNITRSNYLPLMKYGVKIYEYEPGFIHAKNFLADGKVGVVGTINLDYRSLMHHYECGVWMCQAPALNDLKEDFDSTFEKCILMTKESAKMGVFKSFFCSLAEIFTPLL